MNKENVHIVTINEKEFESPESLLNYISKELDFPDYFGMNYNALNDCLGDINKPTEIRIVISGARPKKEYVQMVGTIAERVATWNNDLSIRYVAHTDNPDTQRPPIKFKMIHENYNVTDLDRSLAFYEKALGLTEKRRNEAEDGSFIIVFVGNEDNTFEMELTWLRDKEGPYNLGDEEFHLAFETAEYEEAHKLHKEMGCICFENHAMGLYFIKDPDGYWLEILPQKR